MIDITTQRRLIGIVKQTIIYLLSNNKLPDVSMFKLPEHPIIKHKKGAFVTLKKNNSLRGCVGCVVPNRKLIDQIIVQSGNAATKDERFPPMQIREIEDIKVEISILSEPRSIDSVEQIDINKHGIILEKNGKRALFLPKVAKDNEWTLEFTLSRLCDKAGLTVDDWKHGAKFEIFEAFEFKE